MFRLFILLGKSDHHVFPYNIFITHLHLALVKWTRSPCSLNMRRIGQVEYEPAEFQKVRAGSALG